MEIFYDIWWSVGERSRSRTCLWGLGSGIQIHWTLNFNASLYAVPGEENVPGGRGGCGPKGSFGRGGPLALASSFISISRYAVLPRWCVWIWTVWWGCRTRDCGSEWWGIHAVLLRRFSNIYDEEFSDRCMQGTSFSSRCIKWLIVDWLHVRQPVLSAELGNRVKEVNKTGSVFLEIIRSKTIWKLRFAIEVWNRWR